MHYLYAFIAGGIVGAVGFSVSKHFITVAQIAAEIQKIETEGVAEVKVVLARIKALL